MPDNVWSAAEVEAAVDSYADLFERAASGENVNKNTAYWQLAQQYGRSTSAYQYRFRNISHVLVEMGLPVLAGVQPAEHVGPTATATIRRVIEAKNYFSTGLTLPTADLKLLDRRASALVKRGVQRPPAGISNPPRVTSTVEQFVRSPAVKAWVLETAAGHCENCEQPAPFYREDGSPFLEVHHVKWLATGGSDTVSNAVALCPNCHRLFHHGSNVDQLVADLFTQIPRLVKEE